MAIIPFSRDTNYRQIEERPFQDYWSIEQPTESLECGLILGWPEGALSRFHLDRIPHDLPILFIGD